MIDLNDLPLAKELDLDESEAKATKALQPKPVMTYRHHKDCGGVTHVDVNAVIDGENLFCAVCKRNLPAHDFTWTDGKPLS